jgi:hypothetical protein
MVSPAVEALIGRDMAAEFRSGRIWAPKVECAVCSEQIFHPRVTLTVERTEHEGRVVMRTRFAHPTCAPSRLVEGHPDEIEYGMKDVRGLFVVYGDNIPVFAFEPRHPQLVVGEAGGVDTWVEAHMKAGFVPSEQFSGSIEPLPGWSISLSAQGIDVDGPGSFKHAFEADVPATWKEVVTSHGACVLATGSMLGIDIGALDMGRAVLAAVALRGRA